MKEKMPIRVLNLYACLGGNRVDYEVGKTIFATAMGVILKSNIKQNSLFDGF